MAEKKTKPATPPKPPTDGPSRRLRETWDDLLEQFQPERLRQRFSRENIISALKTLAWVAPLTILIWIWAEREQLDNLPGQTIPIEVRVPGTDKVGTIISPPERNVMVSLRGPRAQLDAIRAQLTRRPIEQRIALDLDPSLEPSTKEYSLSTQSLLESSDFFRPYGVSITDVSPPRLTFTISELESIDLPVRNPPSAQFPNIAAESAYEPSVVRVTAKKQDLADRANLYVYPDLGGRDLTKPGTYEIKGLPLLFSQPLQNKQADMSPAAVNATLVVRETNITYTLNSMPVFLSHPADMLDKYQVEYDPFLERITLIGKRDTIDAIASGKLQGAGPKARLEITNTDAPPAAQPRQKVVQYDLPEGVSVSPEDKSRQVRFTVKERVGE